MKKIIYILLSVFLSISISCQETYHDIEDPGWDNEGDESNKITVMSYNIKYCSPLGSTTPNVDAIADIINQVKPDVVFLQEVDRNTTRSGKVDQLAELSKKTNMPFSYFAKAQDYQGGEFGLAFLSKHSLSDMQTVPLARKEIPGEYVGYSVLAIAKVVINEKKLTIGNTHMALTQENRDMQVIEINEALSASNYPIIFGGDLNATPDNATMVSFHNYGFRKSCLIGCNSIPSDSPNREIDYLMIRPTSRFEVIDHQVITGTQASDHLPIVAVFELK